MMNYKKKKLGQRTNISREEAVCFEHENLKKGYSWCMRLPVEQQQ